MRQRKFGIGFSVKSIFFGFLLIVLSYFILLNIFAGSDQWQKIDHIYTLIFLSTLLFASATNSWVIIPKYLKSKRYTIFLLSFTLNILGWTFFNHLLFDKLIDYVLPGYYFISYYNFIDLLKFFFVFVVLTMLFQLSFEWFQLQETRHKIVALEKEKIDAELKALINQLNPHFLFNSLTVLYSLALKNSAETPGVIIKLSDILRYVIYESSSGKVPLKSEVTVIRNYIDLQQYRINPSSRVNFTCNIADDNLLIEPMLFLPLVENSFKHGVKNDIDHTFIDIALQAVGGVVTFRISNNRGEGYSNEKGYGGVGLKNIEERLKLLYGNDYDFRVSETEKSFDVKLEIKIA